MVSAGEEILPDVSLGKPAAVVQLPFLQQCKAVTKDCLPPILWRALRSLKVAAPVPPLDGAVLPE